MKEKFYTDSDKHPHIVSNEYNRNMYEHEFEYDKSLKKFYGAYSMYITDWYLNQVELRVDDSDKYYSYDCTEVSIKNTSEGITFVFPKKYFSILNAIEYMKKYFYSINHDYAKRDWNVSYTIEERGY